MSWNKDERCDAITASGERCRSYADLRFRYSGDVDGETAIRSGWFCGVHLKQLQRRGCRIELMGEDDGPDDDELNEMAPGLVKP